MCAWLIFFAATQDIPEAAEPVTRVSSVRKPMVCEMVPLRARIRLVEAEQTTVSKDW